MPGRYAPAAGVSTNPAWCERRGEDLGHIEAAIGRSVRDPCREVDGPTEDVAIAGDQRTAGHTRVRGWQAGGGERREQVERSVDGRDRIIEPNEDAVAEQLHDFGRRANGPRQP